MPAGERAKLPRLFAIRHAGSGEGDRVEESGFAIEVDTGRDIITVRYTGPLTLAVAERALDAAHARPGVSPSTAVLLDTTRALVHDVDLNWLRRYQALKDSRGYPSQTTALVVSARDEGHQLLGQQIGRAHG